MTDFSSLQLKILDLKAKIAQDSITPLFLGSLLEELLEKMQSIDKSDMTEYILSAKSMAEAARNKAIANEASINTLLGKNASQAIENFNEVIAFLDGIKDDARLSAFLTDVNEQRLDIDYLAQRIEPVVERTSEWASGFIKTSDGTDPLESV
ncbi:MAG: hypothetical protein K2L55_08495, partial [Muribaculaceae bacterium]|nr:hypothetical protein [Muribaculaceae bacterium]